MRTKLLLHGPVIRRWILLGLIVGVPTFVLRLVNNPFDVPKLALLVTGVSIVLALRVIELIQGNPLVGLRPMLIPIGVFLVPLLLSWILAERPAYSLLGDYGRWEGLIPYAVMVLLGLLVADAFAGDPIPIAWGLTIGAAVTGTYALIQVLGLDVFTWVLDDQVTSKALSTLGNPNFTGGWLGIALPVSIGLWLVEAHRRRLIGVMIAVIAGGWIVSQSYGGWAAGVAGMSVAGGYWFSGRIKGARLLGVIGAALVAIAVSAAVLYTIVDPRNDLAPSSFKQRAFAWEAAVGMFSESPIVGAGPNAYAFEGVQHRPIEDAVRFTFEFPDDPHSVVLALLANTGLLGALGFLSIFIWVGWFVWRRGLGPLESAFLGGLVAYFIQSLVSIDVQTLRLSLWVCLAALIACTQDVRLPRPVGKQKGQKARKRRPEPLRLWPVVAVLAVTALVAPWWALQLLRSDAMVVSGRQLFALKEPEEADLKFQDALAFREEPAYRRYHVSGLIQFAVKRAEEGDREGTLELIDAARDSVSQLEIPDLVTKAQYGRAIYALGRVEHDLYKEALEIYEGLVRLDPRNPTLRVGTADILMALFRFEDAVDVLEPYATMLARQDLDENQSELWGALAEAKALAGDRDGALKAIDRAIALDPEEPRVSEARQALAQESR